LGDALYREYSIPQGRWISPDPAGLAAVDPSNPQSWNRYAYVLNNPLANVDPDGLLSVVPSGCSPVSNNDPEGTSFVDCPPSSSDLDLFDGIFDGILSRLQTTNTVVSTINQGLQAFSNWFNQPRDPGCMAAATGIGASVGGVAGGALGALGGGAAGGTAGSLVPVVGTIGGGAAGAMSGAAAGAAEGALNGAAVGAGAGFIACAQGTGGGGGGGGNVRENKQARDARNQAERETGKKFSRSQERLFHDVDKTGMSYHDMVNLAKDILNGVINMP
jgi:RHS repeat-associated protein